MPAKVDRRAVPNLNRLGEEFKARFDAEAAVGITDVLRSSSSVWPVKTGFSKGRFIAEDDTAGNILVFNTATYAAWLEYGRNSPHRGAALRTIERNLDRIIKAACQLSLIHI